MKREKLEIVFSATSIEGGREVVAAESRLERLLPLRGIEDAHLLELVLEVMRQLAMPLEFTHRGKKYRGEDFRRLIEGQGKWGGPTEAGGLSFCTGVIPTFKQSFLVIEQTSGNSMASWDDWMSPFLEQSGFIQAWLSDVDYDFWQNAKDPLLYQSAGRSTESLPKISNGLPFPLEQDEIDISKNPGRRILRSGYVEAVGSVMWLSDPFWRTVGESKRIAAAHASWIQAELVGSSVLKLVTAPVCFQDVSTAGIQNELRHLLYGVPA